MIEIQARECPRTPNSHHGTLLSYVAEAIHKVLLTLHWGRGQCVGKASCDIDMDLAHMNGGSDPCPNNKNKYVAVEVTCSNPQPPAPAPAPPAPPIPKLPTGAFSPCADPNSSFYSQPWCNPRLPQSERVADMINRMTRAEKLSALAIRTPAIPSLGMPAYVITRSILSDFWCDIVARG